MESQQRVLNNEKPRTVKAGAISFRLAHGPIWLIGAAPGLYGLLDAEALL